MRQLAKPQTTARNYKVWFSYKGAECTERTRAESEAKALSNCAYKVAPLYGLTGPLFRSKIRTREVTYTVTIE